MKARPLNAMVESWASSLIACSSVYCWPPVAPGDGEVACGFGFSAGGWVAAVWLAIGDVVTPVAVGVDHVVTVPTAWGVEHADKTMTDTAANAAMKANAFVMAAPPYGLFDSETSIR